MNNQAELNMLLGNKQGDAEDQLAGNGKSLDDIIPKKKIETFNLKPKTLFNGSVNIRKSLDDCRWDIGSWVDFEVQCDSKLTLQGQMRFLHNSFTEMPRGQITLNLSELTMFKKDQYTPYRDVTFLFSKCMSNQGELMQYKVTEHQIGQE